MNYSAVHVFHFEKTPQYNVINIYTVHIPVLYMYVLNWKTLQKIVYNTVRALHSLVTGTCICDYRVSNIVRTILCLYLGGW